MPSRWERPPPGQPLSWPRNQLCCVVRDTIGNMEFRELRFLLTEQLDDAFEVMAWNYLVEELRKAIFSPGSGAGSRGEIS